jgi:hypothetical protein
MKKMKKLWKTCNTIIAIDLERKNVKEINEIIGEEKNSPFHLIHLFIFDHEKVNEKSFRIFAERAKMRKIKFLVHFFDKNEKRMIKKMVKDIEKNKYFHFVNKMNKFEINLDNRRKLIIDDHLISVIDQDGREDYEYNKE